MTGYVFLGNSTKPTSEIANSREDVKLDNVSKPCLKAALEMGYKVILGVNRNKPEELICPELPISLYDSHTYRSITAVKDNYTAYKNLKKVVSREKVEVIHCNTPVGGMIGRLVAKRCKVKKVIYTAHGFHFYKGAPLFNRTVLKLAEMIMARWTDAIITMNQEDYEAAKKFKLRKGGSVYYVHGVGVDTNISKLSPKVRIDKRKELGLSDEDFVIASVGRLDANKNNRTLINAISKIANPNIKLILCGDGDEMTELKELTKFLLVDNRVFFLGRRDDMNEIYEAVDVLAMASFREGLSRTIMEAMSHGLPCIVSNIRGNVDLIENMVGGFLCKTTDASAYAEKFNLLANDKDLREKMGKNNLHTIKKYSIETVTEEMRNIYEKELNQI